MGAPVGGEKSSDNGKRTNPQYEASLTALHFELDLFWKRSLFFWGFVGASFIAFAAVKDQLPLRAVIAAFGFVCSMVWTLANRGGKYWYENWEQKLVRAESPETGKLYGEPEPAGWPPTGDRRLLKKLGCWWFKAKRYSPSRLAIALSDYVVVLWFCLLGSTVYRALWGLPSPRWIGSLVFVFVALSVLFAVLLLGLCNSEETRDRTKAQSKAESNPQATPPAARSESR